jgi:hypothetical protein
MLYDTIMKEQHVYEIVTRKMRENIRRKSEINLWGNAQL